MLARDGDSRLMLYAAARDHLRAQGYVQVSMRMFRAPHAPEDAGPSYCCQNDGMVGLGAGARSYTSQLHYSSEYAVARTETIGIIDNYLALDETRFAQAEHGYLLDQEDQQRRYVIQSLLTEPGLDRDAYTARFGSECMADLPQLAELFALELVTQDGPLLHLNDSGYSYADTIGPWLASASVRSLMAESGQAC